MSEIQKCPNLVRGGGGQHFSKMSQIQKCPKGRKGGGVNPNWDIVPIFLDFLFLHLPLHICIVMLTVRGVLSLYPPCVNPKLPCYSTALESDKFLGNSL